MVEGMNSGERHIHVGADLLVDDVAELGGFGKLAQAWRSARVTPVQDLRAHEVRCAKGETILIN